MPSELKQRLEKLFHSNPKQDRFGKELNELAKETGFVALAPFWVPNLYQHDPELFESFIPPYLQSPAHEVILSLLPRIEADGHDSLFTTVYFSRWVPDDMWNADLLAPAQSNLPDEQVLRAVQRRTLPILYRQLDEKTAFALYRRNPTLFRDVVLAHLPHWWGRHRGGFEKLRQAVSAQGDEALQWELFRRFASREEWLQELRRLRAKPLPAEQIVAELEKRHPTYDGHRDPGVVRDFIKRYGEAVMPYVEAHLRWAAQGQEEKFLETIAALGDEERYWRYFFSVGNPVMWNNILRDLLKQIVDEEAFFQALQQRMPRVLHWWTYWKLDSDVTLALYRRDPERYRPFLKQYVQGADISLFREAEQRADEEFLDFLSLHFMRHLSTLLYQAYPPADYWGRERKADLKAQRVIEEVGQVVTTRFDQLFAIAPELYVRHAAYILSQFSAYGLSWHTRRERQYNPIFAYLTAQHPEAWQASPQAIQELLESPNIYVQMIALDMLGHGSPEAAQRVIENLKMFRTLLLGRARRNTKKKVLRCLEQAVHHRPELGEAILPLLEEAMDFRSKRAIHERAMVSFVRLRRQLAG